MVLRAIVYQVLLKMVTFNVLLYLKLSPKYMDQDHHNYKYN